MNEQPITFDDFMGAVNQKCEETLGCSAHDLADYPYREDWETCQEDLAFIAPEDESRRLQVFNNHVHFTVEELVNECDMDENPHSMPY